MITFKDVYTDDPDLADSYEHFLYLLLSEREKFQNISHKHMPTYPNHCKFVRSKPYEKWFIIEKTEYPYGKVGAIYLGKESNIGLFILKSYIGKGYGAAALKLFLELIGDRTVFANINPNNHLSIEFFTNKGFEFNCTLYDRNGKPLQNTYIKRGASNDAATLQTQQ